MVIFHSYVKLPEGTLQDAGVKPSNFTLSVLVKLMSRARRVDYAFELVGAFGNGNGELKGWELATATMGDPFYMYI